MYSKKTFHAILGLFALILISLPIGAITQPRATQIICEDGHVFVLEQNEYIESAQQNQVSKDLIIVDKQTLRLTLFHEGKAIKSFPVAIGTTKTPSPVGEWKIIHKGGNWGGGFGVRWLGLNVPWGIYGIHGTDKPGSIGSMSSHGCIRMFNHQVAELYQLIQVGTPVHIIGSLPQVGLRKDLTRKNSGKDVLLVQFALRKAGFDPGVADARFGPGMEQTVKKFQDYYGLAATGTLSLDEQLLLGLR